MSAEDRPGISGNQGGQPDERSLVVRSGQTSLEAQASRSFMELAGFSPQLPERLIKLNDALSSAGATRAVVKRIGLEFKATKGMPLLDTVVEYQGGARIILNAFPLNGESAIDIVDVNPSAGIIFTLKEMQDFIHSAFPDKNAKLEIIPNQQAKDVAEEFSADLETVTEDMLIPYTLTTRTAVPGIYSGRNNATSIYEDCWIILSGENEPFLHFNLRTAQFKGSISNLTLGVYEFHYKGTPEQVEKIMDELANVLSKPYQEYSDSDPRD